MGHLRWHRGCKVWVTHLKLAMDGVLFEIDAATRAEELIQEAKQAAVGMDISLTLDEAKIELLQRVLARREQLNIEESSGP